MSVLVAARTLGQESGWSLSNLVMQKVLYVAQMLHLGRTGKPLIAEEFQAWDYGPVVPKLYHALKRHERDIIPNIDAPTTFPWGSTEAFAIADAYSMMQHMSPSELIAYTHRQGGAWERHYQQGPKSSMIPAEAILSEWNCYMRPSEDALNWAEGLADDLEASSPRYLDAEGQRAFRASLFGEDRQ
ncbi:MULTISPECIES: Panacea domain-containing protein [unclassified Sphingomonas]|uniref:Panacea domain-containing protein n=1 Tax=unclassified Sphingomonas TaxID=196159 RepID=UPI00226AA0DA|nr:MULTISPECIES: Panacea domain-containing protein [unclassified Sphingomonas]